MVEREQLVFDFTATAEARLESVFIEALRTAVKKEPRPEVEARFYPYAGLSSTIRLRRGRVYARVSDILVHSPREVLYALACILVAKLYRQKAPKEHERTYRSYAARPAVLDLAEDARRGRGYKVTTSPRGKVYDMLELFDDLNGRYFGDQLQRPVLTWSKVTARRILGHHDHVHGTITLSRALDSPRIPKFVVEYVLYHEMLHVKHIPRRDGGRTIYHSREFRADERRFEQFDEALKWLDKISLPVRRRRRRRTGGPRRD
jgi:hypothetical protein